MMSQTRMPKVWHVIPFGLLLALSVLLAACGGKSATTNNSAQPTIAPRATTAASAPPTKSTSNVKIPQACALLTAADVEKITGYGSGLTDSRDLGEGTTNCTILAGQGKFKVEVGVGPGHFPVLPTEKRVDLEGGAKGVVKDSGIGQGWMSLVEFKDYSVTLLFASTAATIDEKKKIAELTKADGSKITFAQVYEALARAVARNAAVGAQAPSSVSAVEKKGDPCALITLDEVKQVLKDFAIAGPESVPSAQGGNNCRFRGDSQSLKATAIVGVEYLTQQQFESVKNMMTTSKPSEIGGATAYQVPGFAMLLSKNGRYVQLSIAAKVDGVDTLVPKWLSQLARHIAARMGR